MEVKKLDEALFLSSEALSLLSKYPNSSSSPSDAIAQLQSLCKALLSCLSILQGLERDHHKQYEIQYINREEDERALCAEQLRFSERMTSVYGLVSIVLSQVSHFNVDGEGGNQEEGKEKGAVDTADREEEPTEDVVSLESVYGCDEAKKILLQTIYFPLTFPFLFVAPPQTNSKDTLLRPTRDWQDVAR
ncbi:hypothetical protein AGDE_12730 [Angomonas deanei]|nr:hypothetical protein AGDE_12730 [Angomonas deanei]|eukprot:EPY23789.1 hypothetical protein AGDE_12730 [Angomonas deanei]